MRDKRFIAEHRGDPLKKKQHRQLMRWACSCADHVLPLLGENPNERLINALIIAKDWALGKVKTGDAMKAAIAAHAVARETENPFVRAVARAVGHAVATAHMADHSLGAALYALKAIKNAGKSVETERIWQNTQLQQEIKELILNTMHIKERSFII